MKPNLWIFSLEPIDTRYTRQWFDHVPALLTEKVGDLYNVKQINGIQKNTETTPGAFLNFSDTNYWKSSQLMAFLDEFNAKNVTPNDYFLFTDAWNPTVIQLRYMNDLLNFNWKIGGHWHAGSYDFADFLGRLVGDNPWVRYAEQSFFNSFDHNFFATQFHIDMFSKELLKRNITDEEYKTNKVVLTGWPMQYLKDILAPYRNLPKENLILFPHRVAPEKQSEIFKDLAKHIPEAQFVVCQEQKLTKDEYHTLLGKAKIVFSANLQETLGISMLEGALVDALPLMPDRLSYSEMYDRIFLYPSKWTESWEAYEKNRPVLVSVIRYMIAHYSLLVPQCRVCAESVTNKFFTATNMIETIRSTTSADK